MNWRRISFDYKLLRGDPMLILSMMVPFILWSLMFFIFPLIAELVSSRFSYDITQWYKHALYFFMLLIPMMTGMVYGFILVDERDGGIITAISVSPAGKSGYLKTRLSIPMILSFVFIILFQYTLPLQNSHSILQILLLSALISSQCLIILLVLGAFADNKIVGLAISKGFGILLIGPLFDYILPGALKWLGAYSPMFWTGRAFMAGTTQLFWFYLLIALMIHILIIFILFRNFMRRSN